MSSRIEGTRTTLAELLAAEAGAKGAADSADLREVANYVTALEYGLDRLRTLPRLLAGRGYLRDIRRSYIPQIVTVAPVSVSSRRNTLSRHGFDDRSNTIRWPSSAAQRSMYARVCSSPVATVPFRLP